MVLGEVLAGRVLHEEHLQGCGTVLTCMPILQQLFVFTVRPVLGSSLPSTSHRQPQVPESTLLFFGCPQDFTGVQDNTVCQSLP